MFLCTLMHACLDVPSHSCARSAFEIRQHNAPGPTARCCMCRTCAVWIIVWLPRLLSSPGLTLSLLCLRVPCAGTPRIVSCCVATVPSSSSDRTAVQGRHVHGVPMNWALMYGHCTSVFKQGVAGWRWGCKAGVQHRNEGLIADLYA